MTYRHYFRESEHKQNITEVLRQKKMRFDADEEHPLLFLSPGIIFCKKSLP
jgi:hypothetical protein